MKKISNKELSKIQEKRIADNLGGRVVAGSGSTPFLKGDVNVGEYVIEAKTVHEERKSLPIKVEWIEKIERESFEMGKMGWMLAISGFEGRYTEDYYLVDENFIKDSLTAKEVYDSILAEVDYDLEEKLTDSQFIKELKKYIREISGGDR